MTCASANLSFSGILAQLRTTLPDPKAYPSTAIEYSCPAVASKVTKLKPPYPPLPTASSLVVMVFNPSTPAPVYTATSVSKLLPAVVKAIRALAGAVHRYQTDRPLVAQYLPLLGISGSPHSCVAPTFVPVTLPASPLMGWGLMKLSFCGPEPAKVQFKLKSPSRLPPHVSVDHYVVLSASGCLEHCSVQG